MQLDNERIWDALRDVIDPELGVNIVDLGLVYEISVEATGHLDVTMTMTTPACPLSSYFERVIPLTVSGKVQEVGSVSVEIVWDPRWSPEMMSADVKKSFGWAK